MTWRRRAGAPGPSSLRRTAVPTAAAGHRLRSCSVRPGAGIRKILRRPPATRLQTRRRWRRGRGSAFAAPAVRSARGGGHRMAAQTRRRAAGGRQCRTTPAGRTTVWTVAPGGWRLRPSAGGWTEAVRRSRSPCQRWAHCSKTPCPGLRRRRPPGCATASPATWCGECTCGVRTQSPVQAPPWTAGAVLDQTGPGTTERRRRRHATPPNPSPPAQAHEPRRPAPVVCWLSAAPAATNANPRTCPPPQVGRWRGGHTSGCGKTLSTPSDPATAATRAAPPAPGRLQQA